MYRQFLLLALGAVAGVTGFAQTIQSVTNAAGAAFSRAGIVPGSVFAINGTGLGGSPSNAPAPYPLTWGGVTVMVQAGGMTQQAPLIRTSSTQVLAVLPSGVQPGDAQVTVQFSASRSRAFRFQVVESNLGLFSQDGDGQGPAMAAVDSKLIRFTSPVRSRQMVTLLGTGLGSASQAEVLVGGAVVPAVRAGRWQQQGVDAIEFAMPESAETGESCMVPVAVRVNGAVSNSVTVAKSDQRAVCTHPLGLSDEVLRKLDAGQRINLGVFTLQTLTLDVRLRGEAGKGRMDAVSGRFSDVAPQSVLAAAGVGFGDLTAAPGGCAVVSNTVGSQDAESALSVLNASSKGIRNLNAGTISATAPDGRRGNLTRDSSGMYAASVSGAEGSIPPTVLNTGTWTLSGQGGSEIGSFQARSGFAQIGDWDQEIEENFDAGSPLTFFWNPGAASDRDIFSVIGVFVAAIDENTARVTMFTCAPKATAGSFTVPDYVTALIPASNGGQSMAVLGISNLSVSDTMHFSAPLGRGSSPGPGLRAAAAATDAAIFTSRSFHLKMREYRK